MNGLIFLFMLAVLGAGVHMIAQPGVYVGRGPIPAQGPGNVRAMGVLFAIVGGSMVAFFVVPILISLFQSPE